MFSIVNYSDNPTQDIPDILYLLTTFTHSPLPPTSHSTITLKNTYRQQNVNMENKRGKTRFVCVYDEGRVKMPAF